MSAVMKPELYVQPEGKQRRAGEAPGGDPGPRPLAVPKAREREARLLSKTQKYILLLSEVEK